MPHQCTECGRTFPDGSKEMLSGCPDCGGNKFQFKPADAVDAGAGGPSGNAAGTAGDAPASDGESGGAMSRAKTAVRDLVGRGDDDASANATDPITSSPTDGQSAADASAADGSTADASTADASTADAPATGESTAASSSESSSSAGEDAGASGDRSWPKSGTEEYDTPAERAQRRERDGATADAAGAAGTTESADASAGPDVGAGAGTDAGASPGSPASGDQSGAESSEEDGSGITAEMEDTEDDAQRSARSEVVSPDELPSGASADAPGAAESPPAGSRSRDSTAPSGPTSGAGSSANDVDRADRPPSRGGSEMERPPSGGEVASEPSEDTPDLDELREELNSQFESIKVLDPGKYELNLMELYDREEYIISLQEDGRYVIEVPESWRGDGGPDNN